VYIHTHSRYLKTVPLNVSLLAVPYIPCMCISQSDPLYICWSRSSVCSDSPCQRFQYIAAGQLLHWFVFDSDSDNVFLSLYISFKTI